MGKEEAPEVVLRRAGKTFAFANRFFPKAIRDDIALLYSFCRTADDLADGDGAPDARARALDQFQSRFLSDYQNGRSGAGELFQRHRIPVELALELLQGMRSDLFFRRPETFADLRTYCYRVASTVGLMLCRLWGVTDPAALKQAEALGVAMQLTNIARDVGEDAANGRVYLPQEWSEYYGLAPKTLAERTLTPELRATVNHALGAAEAHYQLGLAGVPALPHYARYPVTLAAVMYRDIHTAIRRNGYDVLNRRASTTLGRKAWLAARTAWNPVLRAA